jgi:hypothetical protein
VFGCGELQQLEHLLAAKGLSRNFLEKLTVTQMVKKIPLNIP